MISQFTGETHQVHVVFERELCSRFSKPKVTIRWRFYEHAQAGLPLSSTKVIRNISRNAARLCSSTFCKQQLYPLHYICCQQATALLWERNHNVQPIELQTSKSVMLCGEPCLHQRSHPLQHRKKIQVQRELAIAPSAYCKNRRMSAARALSQPPMSHCSEQRRWHDAC
jgi:hypothetical protein